MNFQLRCVECGALVWVTGTDDPSTNAVDLDEDERWEWGRGEWPECGHDDFEIIDSEFIYCEDDVL